MTTQELITELESLHKMSNICECDYLIIYKVYQLLEEVKKGVYYDRFY